MSITTVSARDFARDPASAKRAATEGPVFVTDRGRPTYAFLRIEDYYRLAQETPRTLLEVMDALPSGEVEFEPPRLGELGLKPAEFE